MTAPGPTTPAGSARCPEVPARARELAARLSALFEHDVAIVERLNDAQRRLTCANERLWSGLSPDAFGLIYDEAAPAGESHIAALMGSTGGLGGPDAKSAKTAVLGALQETHWQVGRAFHDYQEACEERRRLAVEVGELSGQLTEVLCASGWSWQEARSANVHELAGRGPGEREGLVWLGSNRSHVGADTG